MCDFFPLIIRKATPSAPYIIPTLGDESLDSTGFVACPIELVGQNT